MTAVVVEPTEDVVYVTVASGWRIETWAVFDHWRELVSVIDAGPPSPLHPGAKM